MAPDVPVVGHLHGTELLMLERIADGPPAGWHARRGVGAPDAPLGAALRAPAAALAQPARARRARCWASIPRRCVIAPNGFDPERFAPRDRRPRRASGASTSSTTRAAGGPATTRAPSPTGPSRRRPLADAPVLLVGRAASPRSSAWACSSAPSPARATALRETGRRRRWSSSAATRGSGRASTPTTRSAATGARDVYLAGWHEHDELPGVLRGRRRRRARLGARAVRLGARRGHGLRAAGRSPSTASGRPTSCDRARPAGSWSPTTRPRWPARWRRRSTTRASAGAAASPRAATCTARFAWPALADRLVPALRRGRRDARRRRGRRGGQIVEVVNYSGILWRRETASDTARIARLFQPYRARLTTVLALIGALGRAEHDLAVPAARGPRRRDPRARHRAADRGWWRA